MQYIRFFFTKNNLETKLIAEDFTCITFEPDFKRFHMKELSGDVMQLLKKRVNIIFFFLLIIIEEFIFYIFFFK